MLKSKLLTGEKIKRDIKLNSKNDIKKKEDAKEN